MKKFYVLFLLLFLSSVSCQRQSPTYFQERGRQKIEELIVELQKIESIEDLVAHGTRLKAIYNSLATLAIQARLYQKKMNVQWEMTEEDRELNENLRQELNRLYKLSGAKELIEKYQLPAFIRLDAFEKKQLKHLSKS
ncbi:MAG: hypothetical protein JWO53_6 [Chlamydiia bacterium]|nr:hypothetical protein [Chlamydiia bacterium]